MNRNQYVKWESCISNHTSISASIPQGSILGSLLFSIYINDLVMASNRFTVEAFDNMHLPLLCISGTCTFNYHRTIGYSIYIMSTSL